MIDLGDATWPVAAPSAVPRWTPWQEILFGGRAAIEAVPAMISLINCNSPLRWDDRMLDAQFEYCAASQPVVLTPFLLMGAMSPVTIPAALVQQLAEALSGIALAQLIRPGFPVIFGSFLSNIDMQLNPLRDEMAQEEK